MAANHSHLHKNLKHQKSSRKEQSLQFKSFIGNKSEGQGFADKRKRIVVQKYRKLESKEKQDLSAWSDKLQKLYNEDSSDEEVKPVRRVKQPARQDSRKQSTSEDKLEQTAGEDKKKKDLYDASKSKVSVFHREEKEWQKKKLEKENKRKEVDARLKAKQDAQDRYHKEKRRKHKLLSKKNYKGQPNMTSRMMLLLEKIEKDKKS